MNKLLSAILSIGIFTACTGNKAVSHYDEMYEETTVTGSVGNLNVAITRPATDGKCPVAIICHGLMDDLNKDNMMVVNDSLVKAGFSTVRFDFNGHGKSDGQLIDMNVTKEIGDLKSVYAYVAGLDWVDTTRIAIVGHSLGGMVTSIVAGDLGADKVKAIVLHAPGIYLCDAARGGLLFGKEFDLTNIPDSFELWGGYLGKGFVQSCLDTDAYQRASAYKGKICVIQGTADSERIINGAKKLCDVIPGIEYHELEGFGHSFEEDFSVPASITVEFLKEMTL